MNNTPSQKNHGRSFATLSLLNNNVMKSTLKLAFFRLLALNASADLAGNSSKKNTHSPKSTTYTYPFGRE
jgi:hypothetical protein